MKAYLIPLIEKFSIFVLFHRPNCAHRNLAICQRLIHLFFHRKAFPNSIYMGLCVLGNFVVEKCFSLALTPIEYLCYICSKQIATDATFYLKTNR